MFKKMFLTIPRRKILFSNFTHFFKFMRILMTLKALVNVVENNKNFTVDQR
jgi:hypothetical protein